MNVGAEQIATKIQSQDPKDLCIEYLRRHLLSGFQYNLACSPNILEIVQKEHPAMEGSKSVL